MTTLTVDDRQLIVNAVVRILQRTEPNGVHLGVTDAYSAIDIAGDRKIDVAFLDIEMPLMNGLELAKKLMEINPHVNIIFITGHAEYAVSAYEMYASAYIMKPVTEEAVRGALAHLRYRVPENDDKTLTVRCFGEFEVLHLGRPVKFSRSKTKEMFAYFVDRKGAMCSLDMIYGNLWPEEPVTVSKMSLIRSMLADLRQSFEALGLYDIILKEKGKIGVDITRLDCDYYKYLRGDRLAMHQFRGEYMEQYSFADVTRADLQMKFYNWK